jgi:hypothetical protein
MNKCHVECLPEEVLMLNLGVGFTREIIEHHKGSGAVCVALAEGENLFGLIDEDPQRELQHPYYDKLYKKPESEEHNIRYSIDSKKKNKLVFIKPSFEPWLIEIARKSRVHMSDYNLSDDPDILHREINFKKADLQKLLHHLIKIKCPAIIRLKNIINSSSI